MNLKLSLDENALNVNCCRTLLDIAIRFLFGLFFKLEEGWTKSIWCLNGGALLVLYIQDDRYFGSLYGLETHDKRQNAEKRIKVGVFKENFALAVGWTQFIGNFLHKSILSYPITPLKTSRQQHFTGAHKSDFGNTKHRRKLDFLQESFPSHDFSQDDHFL